tara:strand:+ start:881 stop:1150 length:270 start_codon:yes stop_codon:yes gene_type:complete
MTDDFTKKALEGFSKQTQRDAMKLVDKSPELKRIRSIKDGLKPSEITTGAVDQQYKDNYDKIKWGNNKNKKKPSFKVRVNGKIINDEEE